MKKVVFLAVGATCPPRSRVFYAIPYPAPLSFFELKRGFFVFKNSVKVTGHSKNKDDHRPWERRCNLFSLGNKWMMKKKKLKKNPSNRKPISYSTEFRLDINLNNFERKLCPAMINAFQDTFCYTLHL